MAKQILLLVLLLGSFQMFSQKLIYQSNGNITDSENNKISPQKVRELLSKNQKMLSDYNSGRTKKTVGNVLLIGGFGMITADLLVGLNADVEYPSALTIVGIASVIAAIPVKIGFSKKIKNVVDEYNNQANVGMSSTEIQIITNKYGVGFRVALN